VVKEVHGSGGYGMLVGPAASKKEIAAFRAKLQAKPGNYIAQPTLALSTVPILTQKGLAPRHVDLRPFVLVAPNQITITPGRADTRGAEKGVPGGELVAGRRHQGHLGAGGITPCSAKPRAGCSGCSAILNGRKTPPADRGGVPHRA
jgi:hypothetical protein